MAILRTNTDSKILKNVAGEVLENNGADSNLILSIDTDLQNVNQIHKDATNKVSQITDKAQGIAFVQSDDAKKPIYNYDGYYEFGNLATIKGKNPDGFKLGTRNFTLFVEFEYNSLAVNYTYVFSLMRNVNEIAFGIRNHGTTLQLLTTSNGGNYLAQTVTPTNSLVSGTKYSLVLLVQDGLFHSIVNEEYLARRHFTQDIYGADFLNWQLGGTFGASSLGIKIHQAKIILDTFDDRFNLENSVSGEFNMNHITKPYLHLKRYKEDGFKKLFISSRYLEDAVIDSDDRIEKIYSELYSTPLDQTTLIERPLYTNKGILFANAESLNQIASTDYNYGTDDFFLGLWVDFQNQSVVFEVGSGVIKIGIDATNIYAETSGGKLYANKTHSINEGYKYVTLHRESGVVYLTINGIFESSRSENIDYNTNQSAKLGGLFIGLIDDLLNSHNKEITFVSRVQNNKVFEPPKRRSLDSTFKQYPIP